MPAEHAIINILLAGSTKSRRAYDHVYETCDKIRTHTHNTHTNENHRQYLYSYMFCVFVLKTCKNTKHLCLCVCVRMPSYLVHYTVAYEYE